MDAVGKAFRHPLVDGASSAFPGHHRCCALDVEEIQVAGEQRSWHVEDTAGEHEIDEQRLEHPGAELGRQPKQVEHASHAQVVKRIGRREQKRWPTVERVKAPEKAEQGPEPADILREPAPEPRGEVVRIAIITALDRVAESCRHRLDANRVHELHKVRVGRRDEARDREIDRDRRSIVLGNVKGPGVAAEVVVTFEDFNVVSVGVLAKCPGGPQARDTATHNADALHHHLTRGRTANSVVRSTGTSKRSIAPPLVVWLLRTIFAYPGQVVRQCMRASGGRAFEWLAPLSRHDKIAIGLLAFFVALSYTLELYFVLHYRDIHQRTDLFARLGPTVTRCSSPSRPICRTRSCSTSGWRMSRTSRACRRRPRGRTSSSLHRICRGCSATCAWPTGPSRPWCRDFEEHPHPGSS